MGIYLGATALGGGGGGSAQPGDLVAINQEGTATDDPTTNFIIDYDGGKYLRTGITIPTDSTETDAYSEQILPYIYSGAHDAQVLGTTKQITEIIGAVLSSVEITGSAIEQTYLTSNNYAQLQLYSYIFGGDDTYVFAAHVHSASGGDLYRINKSTGVGEEFNFPFGSTGVNTSISSSARFNYVMGKGLFADKIICAFGNSSTESGLMVLNKDCTVDTSFNAGLFSSGVYRQTGSGSSNPLYYGIALNSNSKKWSGWMKVNPDAWAASSGASHISGSTSGNATIPSSNSFELRYVTIYGYIYPGGHYYTALDHATASLRSGIGLAQNQLAMQWTMEDGTSGPNSNTWNTANFVPTTYSPYPVTSFGDQYDTAAEAQTALNALNTANGTSYNSFPLAMVSAGTTITSNGSVESREVSSYNWSKIEKDVIYGEELVPNQGSWYQTTGGMIFDSSNVPSFWCLFRADNVQTAANPGVNVSKVFLVELPATLTQRSANSEKGAQGYIRPMYYDIRDQSISYGNGSTSGNVRSQRTTGDFANVHHDSLVAGDKRSKFLFPIWTRLE